MATYDFDYSNLFESHLPVGVLHKFIINSFVKITPEFLSEAIFETHELNGLKNGIEYNIEKKPISISSRITNKNQIIIYENFCQFLWAFNYAVIVIYTEGIQKPREINKYVKTIDYKNVFNNRALALFIEGFKLFTNYTEKEFFRLPNPVKYNQFEKKYIEIANSAFLASITYFLLHEFAHHYFHHIDCSCGDFKKEEFDCDDFAFDKFETRFNIEKETTYKVGLVTALASLAFMDNTFKGGPDHPDPDLRLKRQLLKMNLRDIDNIWGISCLAFELWSLANKTQFEIPKNFKNYKELFDLIMDQINNLKQ
jgi:hypothetical protein